MQISRFPLPGRSIVAGLTGRMSLIAWGVALALVLARGTLCPAQIQRQWETVRAMMVESDIATAGIKQPAILAVMRTVPRHEFVPADLWRLCLLRHGPADRRGADDLAAVHRGLHDRGSSIRSPPTRCWKSAPAAATRRPC